MKQIKYLFFILLIALFVYVYMNFDEILCGKIDTELQDKINEVEKKYGNIIEVKPIPCEFRYIYIKLKSDNINIISFDKIHKILWDDEKRLGWITLLILDDKNKYLYSHSSDNKIYKQNGD